MKFKFILFAICLILGILSFYTPKIILQNVAKADAHHYLRMAQKAPAVDITVGAPFGYRILPSWLVGMLPLSEKEGFRLLSTIGLMLLPLLWIAFLQGFSPVVQISSLICLLLNPHLVGFVSFNPYQFCDVITFVLILAGLIALRQNNVVLLSILMCMGILSRETVLLFIPVTFVYLWEKEQLKAQGWKYAVGFMPALGLMWYIRSTFLPYNEGEWSFLQALWISGGDAFKPVIWSRILLNTFAPFVFLPLFFWKQCGHFLKSNLHFLLMFLLILGSCFIAKDKERLLVVAFPIFYLFLAKVMEKYPSMCYIFPFLAFPIGIRYILQTPDEWQRILVMFSNILVALVLFWQQKKMQQTITSSRLDK